MSDPTPQPARDGSFRRKARKQHRCVGCGRTIEVGESHFEDLLMAEGAYKSGPRYCDPCAADAGLAAQEAVCRHRGRQNPEVFSPLGGAHRGIGNCWCAAGPGTNPACPVHP